MRRIIFNLRNMLISPLKAVRRLFVNTGGAIGGKKPWAHESLKELLESWEREYIALERFRAGYSLNENSPAYWALIRWAGDIFKAAVRDLERSSYWWRKLFLACKMDYETWRKQEEAIRKAIAYENEIIRAIRNGDFALVEDFFKDALKHKEKAIEEAKKYLKNFDKNPSVIDCEGNTN